MKRSLIGSLVLAVTIAGLLFLAAPDEGVSSGANVINRTWCWVALAGGDYYTETGATIVETPSGNINVTCHAPLFAGDPVSRNTKFFDVPFLLVDFGVVVPCDVVLTPSGNANIKCHYKP